MVNEFPERRESDRIDLREPLIAKAEIEGISVTAELIDLSEMGAKFRFQQTEVRPAIGAGHQSEWTINLPSGKKTSLKTEARWFHRLPEGFILGVKLLDGKNETLFLELGHPGRPA